MVYRGVLLQHKEWQVFVALLARRFWLVHMPSDADLLAQSAELLKQLSESHFKEKFSQVQDLLRYIFI